MAAPKAISSSDEAETLALHALAWLVSDHELLGAFTTSNGALPESLAELAASRSFLVSLLEFLTADDARVLSFAAANGCNPMAPLEALRCLQGPSAMNWT